MSVIDVPLVVFLKFDGNVIAAQLNLVGGTAMESFIIARDEQFNRYSPGEILTEYCTRLAIERGLDFDFRIMSDDYKQKRSDVTTFYRNVELYLTLIGRVLGPVQAEISEIWAVMFRIYARFSRYAHGLTARKA
jgi:CelD/BcsL family acetyltransferase involved in cellulose biosynthesis